MIETSANDLRRLWESLAIPQGGVVMCHSFLPALGRLSDGPQSVLDTLIEHIGPEGTFIVPTFTYSYFKDEIYDVTSSPSTVGVFGEVVRRHPAAIRSLDPLFSMAAIGSRAQELMARESKQCFGWESIYQKLLLADYTALLLGVDFTALSLFMHLEKLHEVPYRHDKTFSGQTTFEGRTFSDEAIHFVKDLQMNPITHRQRIGAALTADASCRRFTQGYREHLAISSSDVAAIVSQKLAADPFYLIKDPLTITTLNS